MYRMFFFFFEKFAKSQICREEYKKMEEMKGPKEKKTRIEQTAIQRMHVLKAIHEIIRSSEACHIPLNSDFVN